MKKFKMVLFMSVTALLILSCTTTKQGMSLYHKGEAYGLGQPEWIELALLDTKKLKSLYPTKEIFITTSHGTDLDKLERSGKPVVDANTAIARVLATAVVQNINDIYKEQGKKLDTKAVNIANVATIAEISGFIKESDWWIFAKYSEGERYVFTSLYLIDKNLLAKKLGILNEKVVDEHIDDEAIAKDILNANDRAVELFQTVRDNEINPLVDRPN